MGKTMAERLAVRGAVDLAAIDPSSTPGFDGDKGDGEKALAEIQPRLAELQEKLFANGKMGDPRRVLLVLQAMDSGGKDGTVKKVLDAVNPSGVQHASFGKPTDEELAHDFLWRIDKQLPDPGYLGVFNRSHYEDVLIVRVHDLVPREVWEPRYEQINDWEAQRCGEGITFVKVMLHISYEEQRERLLARLDDPTKHWKVNPADITERGYWKDYQQAYEAALSRCSTETAPWHVLPADRKWYRNWALTTLLIEVLEGLDQQWPTQPDLDWDGMRAALEADSQE